MNKLTTLPNLRPIHLLAKAVERIRNFGLSKNLHNYWEIPDHESNQVKRVTAEGHFKIKPLVWKEVEDTNGEGWTGESKCNNVFPTYFIGPTYEKDGKYQAATLSLGWKVPEPFETTKQAKEYCEVHYLNLVKSVLIPA